MATNRWTFKKHKSNFQYYVRLAAYLNSTDPYITMPDRNKMYNNLEKHFGYRPRKSNRYKPLDAVNHRLDDMRNYMFGYYYNWSNHKSKFIISPLGHLLLKHLNNPIDVSKIFATMLYAIQFPTIGNRDVKYCKVRPFRLIFQLLEDPRLNFRLYDFEVENILYFITNINDYSYDSIVHKILVYRSKSNNQKFKEMKRHQYHAVKRLYEWQYYVKKMLLTSNVMIGKRGKKLGRLYHKQKPTSKSKPTSRIARNSMFTLNESVRPLIAKLLKEYKYNEPVVPLNSSNQLTSNSLQKIYSFCPNILLSSIGEKLNSAPNKALKISDRINGMTVIHNIKQYSRFKDRNTANDFELALTDAFNMFNNVQARHLGQPGKTDVECIYIRNKDDRMKFDADAKSTDTKLHALNALRLIAHRRDVSGNYTVVVTPDYDPTVTKTDINKDTRIVIIKSSTLSSYLYQNVIHHKKMDYKYLNNIIQHNLGTDISDKVNDLMFKQFGLSA